MNEAGRDWFSWALFPAMLLAALIVYANTLDHPLLIDDPVVAVDHPDVQRGDGIVTLWTHDYWAGRSLDKNLYRPATVLSFWVNAHVLQGTKNLRLVNIALLAVAAYLVACWLGRYTGRPAAIIAGFLYLLHPLHAAMVNSLVARADLLVTIGVVGALWALQVATTGRLIGAALFASLAMFSKETGLIVIPAALAQQWLASRKLGPGSTVIGGVAALYMLARLAVIGPGDGYKPTGQVADNPLLGLSFLDRLPGVAAAAWFYLRQVIWPNAGYWRMPIAAPTWSDPAAILGLIVLLVAAAITLRSLARRHWLAAPLVLAAAQFAIVGNLFIVTALFAADRSADPFLIAAVALAAAGAGRLLRDADRKPPVLAAAALAAAVMGLVTLLAFNPVWASQRTLMEADLRHAPDLPAARFGLVNALLDEAATIQTARPGDADRLRADAAAVVASLLQRFPSDPQLQYQLAALDLMAGRLDSALVRFQKSVDVDIHRLYAADALNQIAAIHMMRGDLDTAEKFLRAALHLSPNHPNARENMAIISRARQPK